MLPETALVALITGGSSVLVAALSSIPGWKSKKAIGSLQKTVKNVGVKVDDLSAYVKNEKDDEEVRKKMKNIQSYYVNLMGDFLKPVAIMKSDSYIQLIVDFLLGLDFDDINDYKNFQDHLFSGAKYCKIRMAQLIGEELTSKYYNIHEHNTNRFNKIIQKIFFTTDNCKRQKIIAASVDFLQLFMTEMICLNNGQELLDETKQKYRRCDDHM
jgi:hypothetical protein